MHPRTSEFVKAIFACGIAMTCALTGCKSATTTMVTTLENLMTFPCVRTLVERGKLQLHAAYFAVGTGLLSVRDPQTGVFAPLTDAPEASVTTPLSVAVKAWV